MLELLWWSDSFIQYLSWAYADVVHILSTANWMKTCHQNVMHFITNTVKYDKYTVFWIQIKGRINLLRLHACFKFCLPQMNYHEPHHSIMSCNI